jgi:hypothetical protein
MHVGQGRNVLIAPITILEFGLAINLAGVQNPGFFW